MDEHGNNNVKTKTKNRMEEIEITDWNEIKRWKSNIKEAIQIIVDSVHEKKNRTKLCTETWELHIGMRAVSEKIEMKD